MDDLISRSAVLDVGNVRKVVEYDEAGYSMEYLAVPIDVIEALPAIDAVPVVHARWIRDDLGNTRCSNCHTRLPFRHCYDDEDGYEWDDEIDETPWCMYCGARMDGEENAAD